MDHRGLEVDRDHEPDGQTKRRDGAPVCLFFSPRPPPSSLTPSLFFYFFRVEFTVERAANKWPSTTLGQNWQANTSQRMQISRTICQSSRWACRGPGRRGHFNRQSFTIRRPNDVPPRSAHSSSFVLRRRRHFRPGSLSLCSSLHVLLLVAPTFVSLFEPALSTVKGATIKTPSVDIPSPPPPPSRTCSCSGRFKFDAHSV